MTESGRAAVFVGAGKPFDIRSWAVPDPKPLDLVVKVARANVCGSDLHVWSGETNLAGMGASYPMVLGHEMVGVVARLGAKVRGDALGRRLREGDRVVFTYYIPCGRCRACLKGQPHVCLRSMMTPVRPCEAFPHFVGAFAEYTYVDRRQCVFKLPDAVSDTVAAGANCALSQVLHGYERAGLGMGDTVVVQGAGGLGLYACAVAREMGADRVIAIDGVPARLELAKQFGADRVIDLNQVTDPRARVQLVLSELDGWGADVVMEVAGVPQAVPEGIRMLCRGGRYVEIGNINPRQTYKADPSLLVGFNRSMFGVSLYPPDTLRRAVDFLHRSGDRFPLDRLVSHDYALDDIDTAFQAASERSAEGQVARASICPHGGHA